MCLQRLRRHRQPPASEVSSVSHPIRRCERRAGANAGERERERARLPCALCSYVFWVVLVLRCLDAACKRALHLACGAHAARTRTRAAKYVYGDLGSNVCPTGSAGITELTECQSASTAAGASSVVISVENVLAPKGCYANIFEDVNMYLNTHATGAASSVSRLTCILGAPRTRARTVALSLVRFVPRSFSRPPALKLRTDDRTAHVGFVQRRRPRRHPHHRPRLGPRLRPQAPPSPRLAWPRCPDSLLRLTEDRA
jgi:hypothetical protein